MRTDEKAISASQKAYVERLNRAIDYVVNHLNEPIRLDDVSQAAGLSPFHFHRVFQSLVGKTVSDFVKRRRLEKAIVLMAHSKNLSLTEIALECGFSSSSDFSRCFKQQFAVPPSAFDFNAWRDSHMLELRVAMKDSAQGMHISHLPNSHNSHGFKASIRELPARTVAYIRVSNPYHGAAVSEAAARLIHWAESNSFASNQWFGYQWDNPEITALEDCHYHVAVEAEQFVPSGEIGRFHFPPMTVAQVEVRGGLELELQTFQWLYGVWLPASGYVPDDYPCFEAWIGKPFAHGNSHFELNAMLPIKRERSNRC